MEDTATHDAKVSDSAYSNSCNSQSQRSGSGSGCGSGSTLGSTKSHHSRSSGSSSGYCGQPSTLSSGNETFPQPKIYKRNKGTDHKKKKKQKTTAGPPLTPLLTTTESIASPSETAMTPAVEFGGNGGSEETVELPTTQGQEALSMQASEATHTVKKSAFEPTEAVSEDAIASSLQSFSSEMNVEQMPSNIGTVLKVQIPEVTEFCAIVSMEDGIVMHTSQNLEHILGFPKNMWIGHSFIDFVHAKDHTVFASNVASGVVVPLAANRDARATLALKNIFFSRLRCYRGLASAGFSLADACDTYLPFQLTTTLREVGKAPAAGHDLGGKSIFLVIAAKLVQSVYKYAEEVRVLPKFITKHLASCELSHVDAEAVPNLGYLPQDLIGRSVMDFYHPEDLPYLKEVYLTVVKEKEPIFRSKPYRFRVQNGGYVLLETEWSSFINPWTMKLEFVTGQHQALKGPVNPDVFHPPPPPVGDDDDDEAMIEVNHIKEEIQCLLQQTINRATETVRVHAENRYKNLASFMHTLLDDMSKPSLKVDLPHGESAAFFAERDSVMLGEISPHHDYYDSKSKSSTETPPSYTQLNYKENIQRFFESKPKTSASEANPSLPSTDEEGKSLQVADSSLGSITATNRNHSSAVNDSGSGSGSGQSSGSNDKGDTSGDSREHTSQTKKYSQAQGYYQPHHLTEALLYRHNEDMEKEMSRKHRETREHWAKSDRGKKSKKKDAYKLFQRQCQGMKRRGSQSWDVEPHKYAKKVEESSSPHQAPPQGVGVGVGVADNSGSSTPIYQGGPSMNLWPPFSVGVSPNQQPSCSSSPSFPASCMNTQTPHLDLIPVYLIPTQSAQRLVHPGIAAQDSLPSDRAICAQLSRNVLPQHAYVNPGVVFQPLNTVYGAPILYPSMTMLRPSERQPMANTLDAEHKPLASQKTFSDTRGLQRAPSQATSLKAEPGSGMGSIASASIIRCTLSECSKKALPLFSPVGQASSNVSHDGDKFKTIIKPKKTSTTNVYNETSSCSVLRDQSTQDGSCFSSFYSFLKSGKSDDSVISSSEDSPHSNLYRWGILEGDDSKIRDIDESARPVLQEPPWLEKVSVTPDLIYRYQIENKSLDEVLAIDLKKLDSVRQPALVNDQLCQFYVDMELEGLTTRLMLDEGLTSSGGSSGEEATFAAIHRQPLSKNKKKRRRSIEYGKMTMVFEENAPIPPPVC